MTKYEYAVLGQQLKNARHELAKAYKSTDESFIRALDKNYRRLKDHYYSISQRDLEAA